MEPPKFVVRNQQRYLQYQASFHQVFATELHRYFDVFTGFDIVKFDERFVRPNDGVSMKDAVLAQWGQKGVDIIEGLIRQEGVDAKTQ